MSVSFEGMYTPLEIQSPFAYTGYSAYDHLEPLYTLKSKLVRGTPLSEIKYEMDKLLVSPSNQLLEDIVVLMFKTRDIYGQGERLLFRHMFDCLYSSQPSLLYYMMELIPRYGYWKDFFFLALKYRTLLQPAMAIAYKQLLDDEKALHQGNPLSLFAKWIPKEGKASGRFAKEFANYIYTNTDMSFSQKMAALRRRIVKLNAALKTVETLECANRWDEIEPSDVPLVAWKKYRAAFLNETATSVGTILRRPDDEKRLICRVNFQNYTPAPPIRVFSECRYDAARDRAKQYFETV
jgi:hypothetical protein